MKPQAKSLSVPVENLPLNLIAMVRIAQKILVNPRKSSLSRKLVDMWFVIAGALGTLLFVMARIQRARESKVLLDGAFVVTEYRDLSSPAGK